MTKKVIAIVSVLKPVDDARNFEKMASSIGNTNKYEINIIGFSVKKLPELKNIKFHPVFDFDRLSSKRLFASVTVFKLLLKLKPQLTIVTCAELLIVTSLYKILFGGKIIYDVQENYYRNIRYTNAFPTLFRYLLASIVRLNEWICAILVDYFILAEKVYVKQLSFIGEKFLVIENKANIPDKLRPQKSDNKLSLLYSGTIATHYGIFEAIAFVKKLHERDGSAKLRIVGYAPDKRVLKRIKPLIADKDFIQLITGLQPIPHKKILQEMMNANFCLLPYLPSKTSEGRIPTKLYECLAMKKPMIIQQNKTWDQIILNNEAGIIHDFTSDYLPDQLFRDTKFYSIPSTVNFSWDGEKRKLITRINAMFM